METSNASAAGRDSITSGHAESPLTTTVASSEPLEQQAEQTRKQFHSRSFQRRQPIRNSRADRPTEAHQRR